MSPPVCCDLAMQPDSFTRHRNGERSGEQTLERVLLGYKFAECGDTVRLPAPVVVPVKVGW